MMSQDSKMSLWQKWKESKLAACARKAGHAVVNAVKTTIEAVNDDWKRAAFLVCAASSIALAGVMGITPSTADAEDYYTTFNYPDTLFGTEVAAINNSDQILCTDNGDTLIFNNGIWSVLDFKYPGTDYLPYMVLGGDMNDNGQIIGSYLTGHGDHFRPFFYDNGGWITLYYPGTDFTNLNGINNSGEIVGSYLCNLSQGCGFYYNKSEWLPIAYPDATHGTVPSEINNTGQIVGTWYDNDQVSHGFLYNIESDEYINIDYPLGSEPYHIGYTYAVSINDNGQVVGGYHSPDDNIAYHFFSYDSNTNVYTPIPDIDPANVDRQFIKAINNNGKIVGTYDDPTMGITRGFIASLEDIFNTTSPNNDGNCGCENGKPSLCEGNPINAATGNKFQKETDFIGAANTHLSLQRFYNSASTWGTDFGSKWTSTWHRSIKKTSFSTVRVTRADGRVDTYKLSSGVWTSTPDVTSKLSTIDGGGWKLITPDDNTEIYSDDGRLLSITTRNGLVTTLKYNEYSSHRIDSVTGPFGHTLKFTYDDIMGRVSSFTDPDGHITTYSYDNKNNLSLVTYPDGSVRQYLYENSRFPHALTGITDENGERFATYTYDARGRATTTEHAGGVNKTYITFGDNKSDVTDARGYQHSYTFTNLFGLLKPTETTNKGCTTCGGNASYTYYPKTGLIESYTDYNGNVTKFKYNARKLETSRTEAYGTPLARTITTEWHDTYNLPTKITEPNRVTTFGYSVNGNLEIKTITAGSKTNKWQYIYNANSQLLNETGPRGDITSYDYDDQGNLVKVTNAPGHATNITSYDKAGRPLTIQDPNGLVTTLTYDARDRLSIRKVGLETTAYSYDNAGNLIKVTLPDASYLSYTYDAAHRLIRITDSASNHIDYTLDEAGNHVKEDVYDPFNTLKQTRTKVFDELNRLSKEIGAHNETISYGYDANGNQISLTDPLGNTTKYAFDALNRLVQTTNPTGGTIQTTYNANDLPTSVTDPRGLITSYAYDGMGNNTATVSPDSGQTKKTYDAAGNITSSTDARGKKTTYTYDKLNRLTRVLFANRKSINYQYDQGTNGIGRLTKMTDQSGVTTWEYDQQGRVIQKSQKTGTVTLSTQYTYNSSGKLGSITYPSGRKITYGYNYLTGKLCSIDVDGKTLSYIFNYEPFGPASTWTFGSGPRTINRYFDLNGRLIQQDFLGHASSSANEHIVLTRDDAGRLTKITRTNDLSQVFGYDSLSRLTHYAYGKSTQDYVLDANGNRLALNSSNGNNVAYEIAANSNRIISRNEGSSPYVYKYDAAGNLTDDGRMLTYGVDGKMSTAMTGAYSTQVIYNGRGERVKKTGAGVAGATNYYAYDEAGKQIGVYNRQGKPIQETVYMNGSPVGVLKGDKQYYVNVDHLGAPKSLEDETGNKVWEWKRDPFGNGEPNTKPGSAASFTTDHRLPGQFANKMTGLNDNGFRDYDPEAGRYTQPDPIGLGGGINPYVYVAGNPVSFTDPTGLMTGAEAISFCLAYPPCAAGALTIATGASMWLTQQMQSLYDKSNRKVSPRAADLAPPGDCDPREQERLQNDVNKKCKEAGERKCTGNTPTSDLVPLRDKNLDCAMARTKMNNKCFAGGELNHRNAEIDAYNAVANCEQQMSRRGIVFPEPTP